MVRLAASGLCHTDDHLATGDMAYGINPVCGGHEGAGTVAQVGPGTTGWNEGDRVVFSFLPACGKCRWCGRGMQNLCDRGAGLLSGARYSDPASYRMSLDGQPVGQMFGISTFSEYTTADTDNAVKVPSDAPLEPLCLLGCGVGTGWGSAVTLRFGATHAVASIAEAAELARSFTSGQGADAAIVTVGVTTPQHVADAFAAIRKAGTVVVTGVGDSAARNLPISILELTLFQKRLQGALFGASNPTVDIPWLIDLYSRGMLKLDELITARYKLDQIAQGYDDLHAGNNIRGIVVYD